MQLLSLILIFTELVFFINKPTDSNTLHQKNRCSLNKIVDSCLDKKQRNITLSDKYIYEVDSTIVLNGDIEINGNGACIKGKIQECKEGYKSLKLFLIKNAGKVCFKDIIFDGAYTNQYTAKALSKKDVSNLIEISNSSNVKFTGCLLKNITSNWLQNDDKEFGALSVKNSKNIKLINCSLENYKTEGIVFYKCNNIYINNLSVKSETGWTPLNLWYCDGVKCENSTFYNSSLGGTTINGAYSNCVFNNLLIYNGKGIQFSNELNEKAYNCKNIEIKNSKITCSSFGIARFNYDNTIATNINIHNNEINVSKDKDTEYFAWAVRIDNAKGSTIRDCNINTTGNSAALCLINLSNTKIENNYGRASTFCYIYLNNSFVDNLSIISNKFSLNKSENINPFFGTSCFIYIRNDKDSKLSKLNKLYCSDNIITNIQGAAVITALNEKYNININDVKFSNNYFGSPENTVTRYGVIISSINNFYWVNNRTANLQNHSLSDINNIQIEGNILEYSVKKNIEKPIWEISNSKGKAIIRNNAVVGRGKTHKFINQTNNSFEKLDLNNNLK